MAGEGLADLDFCYLTTTGRFTARPHEIEIWFALDGSAMYMLSGDGDRADWVRNINQDPSVAIRIGEGTWTAAARMARDEREDGLARDLLVEKYAPRYSGDLEEWKVTSLPVVVDLPDGFPA